MNLKQSNSIIINIENLKQGISVKTFDTYKTRISSISRHLMDKPVEWIMQHPKETMEGLKKSGEMKSDGTYAACAVAICKLFKVHPKTITSWSLQYLMWQKYLKHYRQKENDVIKESKMTEKQKDKVVSWDSVKKVYCNLQKSPKIKIDLQTHLEYIFFAMLMNIKPKRADMGAIEMVLDKANPTYPNYIQSGTLVLREYKTAKKNGIIKEELPKPFLIILKESLKLFPRQFLFIALRTKKEYDNNGYSHFVRRVFKKYFDKPMGISLWRNVYIRANIDFNEMSLKDIEKTAKLLGHSADQMWKRYRKVDIKPRADNEKGKPEIC